MDNQETDHGPEPDSQRLQCPAWIVAIEDQKLRRVAERLYLEKEALQRKHDSNLTFISSLKSQCTVQQERIVKLQSSRTLAVAAIGGGLAVIGLTALLFEYIPMIGHAAASFFVVLLGRACFPAMSHFFKAWEKKFTDANLR